MPPDPARLADRLMKLAESADLTIATAESCTAGLLAQTLSDATGAAARFHGGFVTYTKAQKTAALGVPAELLRQKGAVCIEVARGMAEGALQRSPAALSAAITGVAGPEPDEDGNPVGHVCIAVARGGGTVHAFFRDYGNIGRETIRRQAVAEALEAMIALASQAGSPP